MKTKTEDVVKKESGFKKSFQKIKAEFREWCGRISTYELAMNVSLVREIEAMEKMFAQEGV